MPTINWPVFEGDVASWSEQVSQTLQKFLSNIPDPPQVGATVLFPGSSVPQGYLPTGAVINQVTYPVLYGMVGGVVPALVSPVGYIYGVKAG